MRRCLVLVTVLVVPLLVQRHGLSFAQTPDEQISTPPVLESPGPDSTLTVDPNPAPQPLQQNELPLAERTEHERDNAVFMLSELRKQVMAFPTSAEDRLRLAQGLYRVGDFEAALDECRMALKLQPNHTGALLQLGILLMAKQEGHGAATAFMEALLIDPELPHAHYSLGGVQYSLGNIKAAMQSYRRALDLQPHFPDAQYRLALLLKLTNRHQDATQFMEKAAIGGVPQAQFFYGNAYKNGQGVEKHLGRAIFWWAMAAESGHQPAVEALGKLRRQALSTARTDRRRTDALEGFQSYRTLLWEKFPDYSRPGDSNTVGTLLLKDNRADAAVSTLLQESYALSDVALAELVRLYETGWGQRLAPFDKNILGCLETVAADGFAPAKTALARIYSQGLGVAPDRAKAKAALKGLSKQDTQALLAELGLR